MKKLLLVSALLLSFCSFAQRAIIDIQPDSVIGATTISMGNDSITGLPMYRRFRGLQSDLLNREHKIRYEEWIVAKDGNVYVDFYKVKTYIVVDKTDEPQYLGFTIWYNNLAPVLLPAINQTLSLLPTYVDNNYVITTPNE